MNEVLHRRPELRKPVDHLDRLRPVDVGCAEGLENVLRHRGGPDEASGANPRNHLEGGIRPAQGVELRKVAIETEAQRDGSRGFVHKRLVDRLALDRDTQRAAVGGWGRLGNGDAAGTTTCTLDHLETPADL